MDQPTTPVTPGGDPAAGGREEQLASEGPQLETGGTGEPRNGGRRERRPRRRLLLGVAGLLAAVVLAAILILSQGGGGVAGEVGRLTPFHISQASALAAPASASAIASRVDPGLVNIVVATSSGTGEATGMVLTPSGVVLTNNHVVQGASSIKVTDVGNGRTYSASVVGYDRSGDVAVIQLQGASGLKTVPLGDSASVSVGDRVTALGNAGGGGGTPRAAAGSVVALGQSIIASDIGGGNAERLSGLIQTDAGVLPGDSGGPLVNDAGQVVGMDAAASSSNAYQTQSYAHQSFAIPIDTAIRVATDIEDGRASAGIHIGPTAFLGVAVVPTSPLGGSQSSGVLVGAALHGYPAEKAGIGQGDVITSVDGQTVNSWSELTDLLSTHHPGDSVHIGWTDPSGQTHTATVKLASGPPA